MDNLSDLLRVDTENLMVFSFLQRRCHPLTRCIKKSADQLCYNVIFLLEKDRKQIFKKGVCPVFITYKEVLPDSYFFDFIFRALVFITKKIFFRSVLTLNASALYN